MKRKRWYYEEIKQFIENEGCELLSDESIKEDDGTVKLKTEIIIKCSCGKEYSTKFEQFKKSKKCRNCARKQASLNRRHSEEFVLNMFENEGYKLLDKYETCEISMHTICPNGHKWKTTFSNFKAGYRCPYCNKNKKEELELNETIEILKKYSYEFISIERNEGFYSDSIITFKCDKGHISTKTISNIRRGKKCYYCNAKIKLSIQDMKKYFNEYNYNAISIISENNNQTRFIIECPEHHKYETTYANFQQGNRCPICNESKGERETSRILDKYNIEYIKQYRFEDCKFKNTLPFDFYLPKYNILIEYDGELHYEISRYCGGFDKFVDTKIRDTIKNEYCKKNNIKLIRIPYWDYKNIEEIIKNELNLI